MEIALVGRDEELGAVATFLDGGFPAALMVAGEAGIGKTSVWRAALGQARERGVRVLVCRPAESEARLSFAGLADLLQPVLDEVLGALPSIQRRALEAALLLSEEERPAPDQRTISTACLSVLRRLAGEGRVLVAVDDVQWLDPPTALVLEFVARRLAEEPIGLLVAVRVAGDGEAPLGLGRTDLEVGRVRLGPLSTGALHRLLRDRLDATLTRPALRKVHEASGGNPFYALELVRALQARGGRIQPGRPLPVPQTLEAILRERLHELPTLALEQAVEAGIIELADGEVRFSHPLLASAAYMLIGAGERRLLHRRLAEVVTDSEERARHLALGADEPSEEVAAALDEAAREAADRGAPAAAAELADLAVRLTPATARDRLRERMVEAARYHLPAGSSPRAQRSSSISQKKHLLGRRGQTRCCSSRAHSRASRGVSSSRSALSSRLTVTTSVSPRSSVTSASSWSLRAPRSRRSTMRGRRWRQQKEPATRAVSRWRCRPSPGSRRCRASNPRRDCWRGRCSSRMRARTLRCPTPAVRASRLPCG